VVGVSEIIGVLVSTATTIIAVVPGTPDVPISTSTLSSSTSFRALRVAAEGSEASSSRMSLILWSPILSVYACPARMPFSYGIPIEAPGPLSEVTKPTVISAPKLVLTYTAKAATVAARRKIMIDLRTLP
jgi:hypothetical protein